MASSVIPQISPTIYFPDGNIVLDVVEDDRVMRFRVHKSLLSRHSDFFRDMFDIPQPPQNPSGLVDGCSVISLTGDSIDDWKILFNALYDPFFDQNQPSVTTIIAMLRLGKKYQFSAFLENAEHKLRRSYPSSLREYRSKERINNSKKLLEVLDEGMLPDDILPALYYDHLYLLNYLDHPGIENHTTIASEGLKLRLLIGYRRLLVIQARYIHVDLYQFPHECYGFTNRRDSLREITKLASRVGNMPMTYPFIPLEDLAVNFSCDREFMMSDNMKAGVLRVWNLLPWCFGLGSWKDLGQFVEEEGEESEDGDN